MTASHDLANQSATPTTGPHDPATPAAGKHDPASAATAATDPRAAIERRVLWLATQIVHHANRVRPNPSGLKVGGHQASSASMVSLMTALWFKWLTADDRVSVKPHAAPVLHAINYLLGNLDERFLGTLRAFGGLQSYPSRTKDPDLIDYTTGSVGIGATAPIWGAIARRYVESHFGGTGLIAGPGRAWGGAGGPSIGRQYSIVGDAELDEGACWEALGDPHVAELGEVVWIVDANRQSLDQVVQATGVDRLTGMFAAAGWQVLTCKYGRILTELFDRPGGDALRRRIDEMPNAEYQRLLRCDPAQLRERLPAGEQAITSLIAGLSDASLLAAIRNLGGHDLGTLDAAFAAIDDTRPTVLFAYTIKGYGLPTEGHPQNHSALLTAEQMTELAQALGADSDHPWASFEPGSTAGAFISAITAKLSRQQASGPVPALTVPPDLGRTPRTTTSTQTAFGRTLLDLTRAAPQVGGRIVTVSPDVSSSTNLGGWVNKAGVWSTTERIDWFGDDAETILHWRERPAGQHIELGIAETNLAGLLGELGATWSRWGQPLLPIGIVYDPFVERALEPWSFGIYAGGQSILVGTPSGVTLASEGGAHQSIKTPSIGLEQPGCLSYEPAFAIDAEWCLLAALGQLGKPGGSSAYLRLSTRPVDQALADVPSDPAAREHRRRQVVAGAYPLSRHADPALTICAMGAVLPEAIAAAARLSSLGLGADVVCVTSPDLLFQAVQARRGRSSAATWILDTVFPANRARPMLTILDGHPHTLAFLAGVNVVPATHLGVTSFGQSGDLTDVYRYHGLDTDSIVTAALSLTDAT